MGITIVQKSDLSVRKKDPKVALVLAGGAVTGGAFKLGGLKALDDFLVNKKTTEFDTYVGLSAGAMLAAPLAAGISPAEMIKSLEGKSETLTRFRPIDFYYPNFGEILSRPIRLVIDALTYVPGTVADVLAQTPEMTRSLQRRAAEALRTPRWDTLQGMLEPIGEALARCRSFPAPSDYLPAGLFDNASIERYLRRNFERVGLPNEFRGLRRVTGNELYIGATNLDTAERVVFGHDEEAAATVSQAVQASTALPGFYKPARIAGVDYIDGGVRRTANIDVAIEHGADLIICYNPFRPITNRVRRVTQDGKQIVQGRPLGERGLVTILNQVFRTLLHSRLQYGLRQYQDDPNFRGDIVVIEPRETDLQAFQLNALAYWQRIRAAQHGYVSVTESIQRNYDLIKHILERYDILMTRKKTQAGVERMRDEDTETSSAVLTNELPSRRLSVA